MQRQVFKSLFLFVLFIFSKSLHSATFVQSNYQSLNQSTKESFTSQFVADEKSIIGIEDDEEKIDHFSFQILSNTIINSNDFLIKLRQSSGRCHSDKKQNTIVFSYIHFYCNYRL